MELPLTETGKTMGITDLRRLSETVLDTLILRCFLNFQVVILLRLLDMSVQSVQTLDINL